MQLQAKSIVSRISDFLKKYNPHSYLDEETLTYVASNIKVQYFEGGSSIFKQGETSKNLLFVLRKGNVKIFSNTDEEKHLVDICDIGQSFGVRSVISGNEYLLDAIADGEALVYAIPSDVYLEVIQKYPKVAMFYAAGFAAGMPVVKTESSKTKSFNFLKNNSELNQHANLLDLVVVKPNKEVIHCKKETTIFEASKLMTTERVGALIICDDLKKPIGIATGSDFIRKVIATGLDKNEPIEKIMSSRVATVSQNQNIALNLLEMTKRNVRHLVITEDGSIDSATIGVISERDLMFYLGDQPATIVKRMKKATSIQALKLLRDKADSLIKNYLEHELSVPFVSEVISTINDILIERIIEICKNQLEAAGTLLPNIDFCWISLGSEGRKEQLLKTDQDNAIVFSDVPEATLEATREIFLKFANKVNVGLNEVGFEMCPGEIMARNPQWCLSASEWAAKYKQWANILDGTGILNASIFFDLRAVYGANHLVDNLRKLIFELVDDNLLFYSHHAKAAIETPPPLSFFKNFVLEKNGAAKDLFDIKKRGMIPLVSGARILGLEYKLKNSYSTLEKYEAMKEFLPEHTQLFEACADAYETLMRYRALSGLKYNDSGRYLRPENFESIEKQMLKFTFKTIEDLQSMLRYRYKVAYLT